MAKVRDRLSMVSSCSHEKVDSKRTKDYGLDDRDSTAFGSASSARRQFKIRNTSNKGLNRKVEDNIRSAKNDRVLMRPPLARRSANHT